MSKTAQQYFDESGNYTGYRGPKSSKSAYSVDGSVTKPHKSSPMNPRISAGSLKPTSAVKRKKLYDDPGKY